jgi:integrase
MHERERDGIALHPRESATVALPPPAAGAAPRLVDVVRERIRYRHYSYRTEQPYVEWVRRFVRFHDRRHPRDMGAPEIEAFLNHLANDRDVAASMHNQALSALLFLYGEVLGVELPWLAEIERPKRARRLPVVLTREEVGHVLALLDGVSGLMARLLYGTGMRLKECVRLRVKDLDLARGEILVRQGKGGKDRVTMVPRTRPRAQRATHQGAHALACRPRRTRFANGSPRICWNPATTFAPCRRCSGTGMAAPRWSSRTFSTAGWAPRASLQ